ncbi:helix-turn-helix domain-containing protein [Arthrobacter sp. UM1]|uniref:helix-turn-helix domain-containing protein n=1 Tax=Arthrobacter sp. UM1 TaxID=2766776 RepID=UPI001CF65C45|nr:helix-turn-helix domain-containing protein [Arthrobacter sp. UM1]MCB4208647.1 helix-turn-helix domain-containing protein [Arthrobacter sp. UM1]
MTADSLTITPEEVRAEQAPASGRPDWLNQIAAYVQRAAAEGELVTLTAKRRMLTPAQVADRTGMSRSTISRKISSGELRAVKVGNRNRIPYEEYLRFWTATMGELVEATSEDLRADLFA